MVNNSKTSLNKNLFYYFVVSIVEFAHIPIYSYMASHLSPDTLIAITLCSVPKRFEKC